MARGQGVDLRAAAASLSGVGPRRARALASIGVETVADLLRRLPVRWEQESAETTIADLVVGSIGSARGEVAATRPVLHGRKRFEAALLDHSGRLDVVWFNGLYLRDKIHPGMRLRVQGKAQRFAGGLRMTNPRWEAIREDANEPRAREERLRPVYAATEEVSSREIEQAVGAAIDAGALEGIEDHLSEEFRRERELPSLRDAHRMMHRPESEEETVVARRRLAYDELLLLQLALRMKRAQQRMTTKSPALPWSEEIDSRIRARLPFTLTPSQDAVVREVAADLSREVPANRLIQGDVGSGKTVVAVYAMLLAAAGGAQSALMAPTEILAEQHYGAIGAMLEGSRVSVALLTGSMPEKERAAVRRAAREGEVDIVVGTHALLSQGTRFARLAVAVIDEQHRFGVHQRAALRERAEEGGTSPHVLVMTATPIPRTMSLTVFGDLDVSTIRGLPPGRIPVTTRVVGASQRDEVYGYVRTRIERGEQAYIVAPTIGADDGPDEQDEGASAGRLVTLRETMKTLEEGPLSGKRLAALHGRLKRETRDRVMARFRAGAIDALVATTVIEVGVDVPNASVMVVEHAERFGLAQLHQLRGRVGRGAARALCVLIGEPATEDAAARLEAIGKTSDGFALAERDFELRGPGELFGTRQSGIAPFRVAEFPKDMELLMLARRDAAAWIERSPTLSHPDERYVRARTLRAHGEALGLGDVA